MRKAAVVEWERRWRVPVAVMTLLAVLLLIGSSLASEVSGSDPAEFLRSVDEHHGSVALSGILQAVGFLLLTAPLFYLFRAARARSERVRPQMVGLILVAPLFLAVSSGLTIGARTEAADKFVGGEAKSTISVKEAKEKCVSDRKDEGAKEFKEEFEPAGGESALAACEKKKTEEDAAENAISDASLFPIVSGLGLAGGLAFVVSFFYSCLWAMRTGLLTRFWGSLGMASGIVFLLGPVLLIIALVWLLYFAFLLIGRVPGGRPPAWEAGEAVPWPTPGEKAAAELEPSESSDDAEESEAPEEKRKRKQRPEGQSE
jgi:hypothetical protein